MGATAAKITRRRALAAALVAPFGLRARGRGTRFDQPRAEIEDPLTERKSFRLTDPDVAFFLPYDHHRAVARRADFLLLGGRPSGEPQIYRYDVGRERVTQLTEGADVDPYSALLDSRDRQMFYVQGDRVLTGGARSGGSRTVYRSPEGRRPSGHLTLSTDGSHLALIEMRTEDAGKTADELAASDPPCRLVTVAVESGSASVVAEENAWLARPQFQPGGSNIVYAREGPWETVDGRLRLIGRGGGEPRNLRAREGEEQVGAEHWTADGSSIRFVHHPGPGYRGAEVRQLDPRSGVEIAVGKCSAFGWMRSNLDGSAIVGASRRPSGPNIYVLFTRVGREITLAEHLSAAVPGVKSEEHACPAPAVSDDSQWVFFTSARDGLPAVYQMKVEDLISET